MSDQHDHGKVNCERPAGPCTQDGLSPDGYSRRQFLIHTGAAAATWMVAPLLTPTHAAAAAAAVEGGEPAAEFVDVTLRINGREQKLRLDPRVTLLDALRERLALTGTKKGCDHGQCGACTLLVNGRRINSCLALAVMHDGAEITTIEGLAQGDALHPVQAAFIKHDGFQCGYCTSGQICSAVALLGEARAGALSAVTAPKTLRDPDARPALSDDEIRERMSGNLCRCGAYGGIVAAVRETARNRV